MNENIHRKIILKKRNERQSDMLDTKTHYKITVVKYYVISTQQIDQWESLETCLHIYRNLTDESQGIPVQRRMDEVLHRWYDPFTSHNK